MVQKAILCILDGWGWREERENNAIACAHTPFWDKSLALYPHALIGTDGPHVGLPEGQMGNSEVGHMNIGAGRVALPEFGRIDSMLGDGSMRNNPVLRRFMDNLKETGGACHLLGLLSEGGVHSHQDQIMGWANILAAEGISVFLHLFTDGRDTPPRSALGFFKKAQEAIDYPDRIKFATLAGRFWGMDRDKRWERISASYDAIIDGKGRIAQDWQDAIQSAYAQGEDDEFIAPSVLSGYVSPTSRDGILMGNFRADRAREILEALLLENFDGFERQNRIQWSGAIGAVKYSSLLEPVCTPMVTPLPYPNGIGEYISGLGLSQLRIAETEKYAHVTFFINGGVETVFPGEDRILIPSPKVKTYDLAPEMSAYTLTESLVQAIETEKYDMIIVNFANADMVGHTGILTAAIQAIETLGKCLEKIVTVANQVGYDMVITADHGNSEMMRDPHTNAPHTQHTTFLVPILVIPCDSSVNKGVDVVNGRLADIAPTLLDVMNLPAPPQMTGKSLLAR